ncbi:MAG: ClbS/DfsB family four-helix bundle protein [Bacteroidota bacterium]
MNSFDTLTKREFLQAVNVEWDALYGLLRKFRPDLLSVPKYVGEWSINDVIGHITSWEEECLERIEQMQQNRPVQSVPDEEVPRWNQEHVEAKRSRSLKQVASEFESVHRGLVKELESIPDGELVFKDGIVDWLLDSTSVHYSEHRRALEATLSKFSPDSAA